MDWKLVKVENDVPLIYQLDFLDDQKMTILLSNFTVTRKETLLKCDIQTRLKNLNKNIEYNLETALEILKTDPESVTFVDKASFDSCDLVSVKFKFYKIGGNMKLPFFFSWDLEKCPQAEHSQSLIFPLMKLILDLKTHQQDLLKTVEQKEAEILEYKNQGVSLINRFVETKPFDSEALLRNCSCLDGLFTSENKSYYKKLSTVFNETPKPEKEENNNVTESMFNKNIVKVSPKVNKRKFIQKLQRDKIQRTTKTMVYEDSPDPVLEMQGEVHSKRSSNDEPETTIQTNQPKAKKARRALNI